MMPHREEMVFLRVCITDGGGGETPILGRMNVVGAPVSSTERNPRRHVHGPDNRVANRRAHVIPSMVLGIEPTSSLEDGLSMIYGTAIVDLSDEASHEELCPHACSIGIVGRRTDARSIGAFWTRPARFAEPAPRISREQRKRASTSESTKDVEKRSTRVEGRALEGWRRRSRSRTCRDRQRAASERPIT